MQKSGRRYLLQGLMVCQCCKHIYYGTSNVKGGRSYYRYSGNHFGGNKVCSSKSIHANILEKVVWEEVSDEKRLKKELDFITSSIKSFFSEVELEVDYETKLDIIRKLY